MEKLHNNEHEKANLEPTAWDKMGEEVAFQPEEAEKQKDKERQYRKVVAGMLYDYKYLGQHDIQLPNGAEDELIKRLNDGSIDEAKQSEFLRMLKVPSQIRGAEAVGEELSQEKHMMRILGYTLDGVQGFQNYDKLIAPVAMVGVLMKYPTPVEFKKTREDLLDRIKALNTEEKYQEYVEDMDKFEHAVYGKRKEYYDRIQELKAKKKPVHKVVPRPVRPPANR